MTVEKKSERNYGIDLLRFIAMFYVVILHTLGGGGLNDLIPHTFKYNTAWFLETFAYCAVDIFILITGYISYRTKPRKNIYTNYLYLWFQVVFYLLIITFFFQLFIPELVNLKSYLNIFFPVLTNQYWYFTAYTGLVIFMPIIDEGIRVINNNNLKKIFTVLIFLFSFYAIINEKYGLNSGYTLIWFIILYIMGGIIKKCNLFEKIKVRYIIIGMTILFTAAYLYQIIGKNLTIGDLNITNIFLVNYIGPTILLISVGYLLIFSKMKFKNKNAIKIISFFAPTTFAIYLFNSNHLIAQYLTDNGIINFTQSRTVVMIIKVILFSLVFSIISMLIDKIRIMIFNKIKIKEMIQYIIDKINKVITMISNVI